MALAEGQADEALADLTVLLTLAEGRQRLGDAVEVLILRALAYQRLSTSGPALADLRRALGIARPEGYVRVFLDEGRPVADLLRQLMEAHPEMPERDDAYTLLAALEPSFTPPPAPAAPAPPRPRVAPAAGALVEPLSPRELEILRLIEQGHSNQEIAGHLMIALNTVKKHTSSIFAKLGVASRTQAVAHGRELGLIP